MAEAEALTLGEIQRRFTESLQVIDALKTKLGKVSALRDLVEKSGEQLGDAAGAVTTAVGELVGFTRVASEAITAFEGAMTAAGKVIQQTTLADLEIKFGEIGKSIEGTTVAQLERISALEKKVQEVTNSLERIVTSQEERSRVTEATLENISASLLKSASDANARAEAAEVALNRIPEKYRKKFAI
jgi:hypothetical protein